MNVGRKKNTAAEREGKEEEGWEIEQDKEYVEAEWAQNAPKAEVFREKLRSDKRRDDGVKVTVWARDPEND